MIYVLFGILCVLLILIYVITKKKQSYWIEKGAVQCEPTFLIGNLTEFLLKRRSNPFIIDKIYNRYPDSR